jgi:hypothetical protein
MIMVMDKALACLVDLEAVKEELVEQVFTLHQLELEILEDTLHLKEIMVEMLQVIVFMQTKVFIIFSTAAVAAAQVRWEELLEVQKMAVDTEELVHHHTLLGV